MTHDNTWIQTFPTGTAFDLANPRAPDIHLEDVAHALSMLCRFTGHVRWHYSVAQHAVLVAEIVEATAPEFAFEALHHDDGEAYYGDRSTPLKEAQAYHANATREGVDYVEAGVDAAVSARFSLRWTPECRRVVKAADLIALVTERRDLLGECPREWFPGAPAPLDRQVQRLDPATAEIFYLHTHARLLKARKP